MKKRKLKQTLIVAFLGIVLGLMLGHVASKLCLQDTLIMVIALLISVIVVALILIEDIDRRIQKAYCRGKRESIFSICRPIIYPCKKDK